LQRHFRLVRKLSSLIGRIVIVRLIHQVLQQDSPVVAEMADYASHISLQVVIPTRTVAQELGTRRLHPA